MHFSIKFYSTRSGKSLLITQKRKSYLFGYFEGMQRHAIQEHIRLTQIQKFCFFTREEAVPFVGCLMGMNENVKNRILKNEKNKKRENQSKLDSCAIDVTGPPGTAEILEYSRLFAPNSVQTRVEKDQHIDENLFRFDTPENDNCHTDEFVSNYLLIPEAMPGKFCTDKLEKEFPNLPVRYRRNLKLGEKVEFQGQTIDGNCYVEKEQEIGGILLLYSEDVLKDKYFHTPIHLTTGENPKNEFHENIDKVRTIICFNEKVYENMKNLQKGHLSDGFSYLLKQIWFKSVKIIHFIDNQEIDLLAAHKLSEFLNKLNEKYLVPIRNIKPNKMTNGQELTVRSARQEQKQNKKIRNEGEKNADLSPFPLLSSPAVIFLGTGAAIPSKYRNVSSCMYFQTDFAFLFDCGEDTTGQISRVFGLTEILNKLKFIFISHSHADHHLGLVRLLREREKSSDLKEKEKQENVNLNENTSPELEIIQEIKRESDVNIRIGQKYTKVDAIVQMDQEKMLKNVLYLSDADFTVKPSEYSANSVIIICPLRVKLFLDLFSFKFEIFYILTDIIAQSEKIVKMDFSSLSVELCGVKHLRDSCAIRVNAEKSVSFSGDCRPSENFCEMSKNVDLMVHESTFTNNIDRAKFTNHTTMNEAVDLWKKSGAKHLVLTHFSQRMKSQLESNLFSNNDEISDEGPENTKNGTSKSLSQASLQEGVFIAYDYFLYDFQTKWKKIEELKIEEKD